MKTGYLSQTDTPARAHEPEPRASDTLSRVAAAALDAHSLRDALDSALALITEHFRAAASLASIARGTESIECLSPAEPAPSPQWIRVLRAEALEAHARCRSVARLYSAVDRTTGAALIAAPLASASGDAFGSIALFISCAGPAHAEAARAELRALAAVLAHALDARRPRRQASVQADDLLRVLSRCAEYRSTPHFAFALVGAVRARLACEQAALGIVSGPRVSIAAISGLDEVRRRSPGVHRIEQAMGECLDHDDPVVSQTADTWTDGAPARKFPLHERWRVSAGQSAVASIPIRAGDRTVAILSLRKHGDRGFSPDEIDAAQRMVAPTGAAIPLVQRATRSALGKTIDAIRHLPTWATSRSGAGPKIVTLAAVAALLWFFLGVIPCRISIPTAIRPAREFIVAAPETARLEQILVAPGDRVSAGQVVARMESHAMALAEAELVAELRGLDLENRRLTSIADTQEAAIVAARADVTRARLESTRLRIEECKLRAQVDGVVIGPPAHDRAGEFIPAGQPVVRIAADGDMSLELRIPERRAADVAAGATVSFRSHARPEHTLTAAITGLAPAAEARDGALVFLADAPLATHPDWLRPGMEGITSVTVGDRPVWRVVLNRAIDTFYLHFWPGS